MTSFEQVKNAMQVLGKIAVKTPLIAAHTLLPKKGELFIKAENLQLTGSFKLRGAYYKISRLSDEEKSKGVIACSAGNHAQGVALAAQREGLKAVICMPDGAPISKVEATRSYGAEAVLVPGVYDDAYDKAVALQKEFGYTFVHPFDDEDVIAGQGTIGIEIMETLSNVDAVLVPIGGGGLISGVALAVKSINPKCRVYGVQASGAPSMLNSIKNGAPTTLAGVNTIADGIAVKRPGGITFDMVQRYVDDVVTVSESEIASAMLALLEKHKIVAEGAGAVSVAAAMFGKVNLEGKRAVSIVSGGNVDVNIMSRVITRGLAKSGRITAFSLLVPDKRGQLAAILKVISETGANVLSVYHNRENADLDIGNCYVDFVVETRNNAHIDELINALNKIGYIVRK